MYVIAVLNQKGGSGKTTIATHLARALQLDGAEVLLVDSDPQGSARDWAAVREDQPLTVVGIDRPTIDRDIKQVARKDFVVIDGAPQAADLAVSAIKAASFVLIPVQPSAYDVWASNEMVELVAEAKVFRPQLRAAFVINRRVVGTVIGRDARSALADQPFKALHAEVSQRIVFADSVAAGLLACEVAPRCAAAREIAALASAVRDLLR